MGLVAAFIMATAAPSQAAMTGAGLGAGDGAPQVELAQIILPNPLNLFFFGGRDYCWYDDGWRGPGWYWCGYGYRHGFGWGGGEGFHGWTQHRYERDWHGHPGGHPGMHPGGHPGGGGGQHHHDDHQH